MTGINIYPFRLNLKEKLKVFESFECNIILPFTLCLSMPVFIYNLVREKEMKLIEFMKINGLLMKNYWIV